MNKYFKNKSFLIVGGTGSFGKSMVLSLLNLNVKKIVVFSRDELKQFEMRNEIKSNKIFYHLGDVRDRSSLKTSMRGIDFIFFAAALKQVPSCEFFPDEAVKTNFFGALNLIELADEMKIRKIVFLSTDKSVEPINSMGMTKSLMEKLVSSRSVTTKCKLIITRYGNVMGSRGSVIPSFIKSIEKNNIAHVTSKEMTRFMMHMSDAIELVLYALEKGKQGCIYVRKCPSAHINTLAESIAFLLNKKIKIKYVGIRAGEKINETLISKYEMFRSTIFKTYFEIKPEIFFKYEKFVSKGFNEKIYKEYSSKDNPLDLINLSKFIKPLIYKNKNKL